MRFPRFITLLVVLSIAPFGIAACGDDDDDSGDGGSTEQTGGGGEGGSLKIYSSLPLQGASRPQTTALVPQFDAKLSSLGLPGRPMTTKT